MRRWK
jgi:hypothetical protein